MKVARGIVAGLLGAVMIALPVLQCVVLAYEVETHAEISRRAYELAGIENVLAEQIGRAGRDKLRSGSFSLTPVDWLRKGSIDEDNQLRHLNHFYDPFHNRGLIVLIPLGQRSHEWGLEDPREIEGQDFSYRDAREHFRLSLTESDPKVRERRLGDTFYALGHAIHLIQDLASPPHTRNGPHAGGILGPPSVVERYLDLDGVRQGLRFDGYPIPKMGFTKPRDFWVETDASGAPLNGPDARGLSQIINRNFVSEGTNFTAFVNGNHHPEYAEPILRTAECYEESVETQDAERRPIRGLVQFCRNSFRDPNTGVLETNPRMTTFSLFGRDLQELGFFVPQGFSLNALNAISIGELTIPRAVAYSAGLLNYFFRGTLNFEISARSGGPNQHGLTITNTSNEAMQGIFTLYADNADAERHPVLRLDLTLEPGATSAPLSFGFPIALEQTFVLVFEGQLGNERGAVVGKIKKAKTARLAWVATQLIPIANVEYEFPRISPITLTMKYKNIVRMDITTAALDINGGVTTSGSSADVDPGRGHVILTGTVPDLTDVTISLREPIPPGSVQTSIIMGVELSVSDGFLCIFDIFSMSARITIIPLGFSSGFRLAECPE